MDCRGLKGSDLEKCTRIPGIKDKNGKPFHVGDYVKRIYEWKDFNDVFAGKIIFGNYSAGEDHDSYPPIQYKTIGYFVKYSDKSGTTGLDSGWQVVSKKEYERIKNK